MGLVLTWGILFLNICWHRLQPAAHFRIKKVWRVETDLITMSITWDMSSILVMTLPHLWSCLKCHQSSLSASEGEMHVHVLECEYAHECSGACIPLCVVSVCVPDCCGTERGKEWENEKERMIERQRAVGEEKQGKLKLHDECIGAQNPDRDRQSKHRYGVFKQTVRGRGDFPMEARLQCWTREHGWIQIQWACTYDKSNNC